VGPPMTVEFRRVSLKHLGGVPNEPAKRGDVEYESGTLAEPEHGPTFDNLADQAARITASGTTKTPSIKEVRFRTRDLAVVRSDLSDIQLFGQTKKPSQNKPAWDLIVMNGDDTYRVPGAGLNIVGKRHDVTYDVAIEWSDTRSVWVLAELTDLAAAAR